MSESLVAQVEGGRLDLGFIGLWHTGPRAGLTARVAAPSNSSRSSARDHPWRRAPPSPSSTGECADRDFPEGTGARRQSDDAFAMAGLPRKVVAQAGSASLVAALTEAGTGVGFLPESDAVTRPRPAPAADRRRPIRTVHMISKPTLVTPPGRAFADWSSDTSAATARTASCRTARTIPTSP
ncbi:hypothetical protein GTA28_24800 [Rhodococcus hoagii]|nr:hypothetical protein [Prescottella equi]